MELGNPTGFLEIFQHPLAVMGIIAYLTFKHFSKQQAKNSDHNAELIAKLLERDAGYNKSSILDWNKRLEGDIDRLEHKVSELSSRLSRIESTLEIIRKKVLNGHK